MGLLGDLTQKVNETFALQWTERNGRVVPEPTDVPLGNVAVHFDDAVVLYADINGSTQMVETMKWHFSAEIYKTYLYCAARVIREEGGEITAYDGDRIMGIFLGDSKNSDSARCALRINYCVDKIINPGMRSIYKTDFVLRHVVGVDRSQLRAARTGARGDNDLVWVGNSANYAAKLTSDSSGWTSIISSRVYNRLRDDTKFSNDGKPMWTSFHSEEISETVYGSNWIWNLPD